MYLFETTKKLNKEEIHSLKNDIFNFCKFVKPSSVLIKETELGLQT